MANEKNELISLQRLEDYSSNMFRDANVLKRSTAYVLNDTVSKGLIILKCSQAGTTASTALSLSGVAIDDELTDGTAKWKVISLNGYGAGSGTGSGLEDWQTNHDYKVDDIYVYENQIYKVIEPYTSSSTYNRATKVNDTNVTAWTANTAFTAGDIIEHQDATTSEYMYYSVNANFTSGATFEVTAEMDYVPLIEEYVPHHLTKNEIRELVNSFNPSGTGINPVLYNDTPIGTIIAYMGITAPKDYLICDGQTYNIADYKELAEYIKVQFGSYDYFGGNGTTTFAVPDLRGEFLRGTGTNSHINQGSGANVGSHQDGTYRFVGGQNITEGGNTFGVYIGPNSNIGGNYDYIYNESGFYANYNAAGRGTYNAYYCTYRPTNTSVLYCIKYTTSILSTPENNYSTEEQRIGTWIDGKPLYQKTYNLTSPVNSASTEVADLPDNVDTTNVVDISGLLYASDGGVIPLNLCILSSVNTCLYIRGNKKIIVIVNQSVYQNVPMYITLKYTKTTD